VHFAYISIITESILTTTVDSDLDVLVAENMLAAFHFEESREERFELLRRYASVYEDVDDLPGLAEAEFEFGMVFCSCVVVAA
jgi:hypothetical protein